MFRLPCLTFSLCIGCQCLDRVLVINKAQIYGASTRKKEGKKENIFQYVLGSMNYVFFNLFTTVCDEILILE